MCAEMGAAMLCDAGIDSAELVADSASYLASWLGTIRENSTMVIRAASQATRAAEYIVAGQVAGASDDEERAA
jgi:antirestriction protein ArdC